MPEVKQLSFTSADRTSGTTSKFKIVLTQPIQNVNEIFVETIIIPKTWYTIMANINDQITVDFASTDYVATLVEGVYNVDELVIEIARALNAAYVIDNLFTVAISGVTKKITITHSSTAHIIEFGTTSRSAGKTLGYLPADTSSATSHEADNIYDLSFSNTIYIISNALGSAEFRVPHDSANILFNMPVVGNFGDKMIYENQGSHWFANKGNITSIRIIDIDLVFDDMETNVPLNGAICNFTVSYNSDHVGERQRRQRAQFLEI